MSRRDLGALGEFERALGELEALLFAAPRPWTAAQIGRRLSLAEAEAGCLLGELAAALKPPSRGLQVREAGGKWRLETKTEHEGLLAGVRVERGLKPLSLQALECLAVVARKQPVTTEHVTETREKDSYAPLATLRKRGLIVKVKAASGKGAQWRTTAKFLERSGFSSVDEIVDRLDGITALSDDQQD